MTKFLDLDESQKQAFAGLMLKIVDRRVQEEITYANQITRLLLLGNGAGLALLGAFMGVIAGQGNSISSLVSPLWKFLLGAVVAASIFFPLASVAADATRHTGELAGKFFNNEIHMEEMRNWGLNKTGKIVVALLTLASIVLFTWASVQCILILKSL